MDVKSSTSDNGVVDTAKKMTSDVANRASDIAGAASVTAKKVTADVADKASNIASAASEQAKTFASELQRMGRAIGLLGRGGRS